MGLIRDLFGRKPKPAPARVAAWHPSDDLKLDAMIRMDRLVIPTATDILVLDHFAECPDCALNAHGLLMRTPAYLYYNQEGGSHDVSTIPDLA